jgi:lysophospholipase L1-like esterase
VSRLGHSTEVSQEQDLFTSFQSFSGIVCFLFSYLSSRNMSGFIPNVLVFGHSFVRRLNDDLNNGFDSRAKQNFNLAASGVYVSLKGTGGRTVDRVFKYDISFLKSCKPDIVVLEIGTNDLSNLSPEVVGSRIDDLVRYMLDELNIKVIAVCQVINRRIPHSDEPDHAFNAKASMLRQYLSVVLANEPGVFLWDHRKFDNGRIDLLSLDGVHCNPQGQYILYRSYRGAILKALNMLHDRY